MLWELCGVEWGVPGGRDVLFPQLVGGIAPLQIGLQAKACQNVLFHNPGEKRVTILAGDVLGHAKLAGQGRINPAWPRLWSHATSSMWWTLNRRWREQLPPSGPNN